VGSGRDACAAKLTVSNPSAIEGRSTAAYGMETRQTSIAKLQFGAVCERVNNGGREISS